MKVWTLPANEDWICDRMTAEWNEGNPDIVTTNIYDSNIVWLLSDWCWNQVPAEILRTKKVVTTVHHVVPDKFNEGDFLRRDAYTDTYHVFNNRTWEFVKSHTAKPIVVAPYWANQNLWYRVTVQHEALKYLRDLPYVGADLPDDGFIVGSFQRDTEGSDLTSPKLEKGPDLFADAVIKMRNETLPNIHVLLGGWRRQYLIGRLEKAHVPYTYIERPPLHVVGIMYQALNLYVCTARFEGGPQALIECGLMRVPMVTTPVGIAEQVLPASAINVDVTQAIPCIPLVRHMHIPDGFKPYREMFERMSEQQ